MESTRRASLIYKKARQMRAQAVATWASSSRIADVEKNTTEDVVIAADTTDGVLL